MSDALRPILVNKPERTADAILGHLAAANGDRLLLKVRLADAIDLRCDAVERAADKGFMLMSHFDFLIIRRERALFAVEIDGKRHSKNPQTIERDRKKDAVCEAACLPMLRVTSDLALEMNGRRAILEYIADSYYLAEAFFAAQERGEIPWDEPFDRESIMETLPDGTVMRGLGSEAIRSLGRYEQQGKIPNRVPDMVVVRVPSRRNVRCLAYLAVAQDRFLRADVQVRDFRFVGLTPGELAENLAIMELQQSAATWISGSRPVAVNTERLAKDFGELQEAIDNGNLLSAGCRSTNALIAGGLPPLTTRFGR